MSGYRSGYCMWFILLLCRSTTMLELSACVLFVRVSHRADCFPERDLLSISTRKELANPFTHFSTSLLTEVFMRNSALQDIAALLGCPAAGNPAQYLFERAIAATGLDWRFLTFDVSPDSLRDALKRELNRSGFVDACSMAHFADRQHHSWREPAQQQHFRRRLIL